MLLLFTLLAAPAMASERTAGLAPAAGSDAYDYPVRPGTAAWQALETHDEMVRVTDVDPSILAAMSNQGLIRTVLDYPLLGDVRAYNTPQQGFEALRMRFEGLRELLERPGVPRLLLRRYQRIDASVMPAVLSLEEQGGRARRLSDVELLLAQPEILTKMNDQLLAELLEEILVKRDQKLSRVEVYGLTGIESTAFTAARALWRLEPEQALRAKSSAFLETGSAWTVEILDEVFARTEAVVAELKSPAVSEKTGLTTKDYGSTVYTPKGTPVSVTVKTYELSSSQIANCNAYIDSTYSSCGAVRLTSCSRLYNCHSYAWYSQSPSNNRWMNTPNDDKYWQDGSYQAYNITAGRKISYASDDHSAIANSSSEFVSKWGEGPLMRHPPSCTPYNSSTLYGYRLTPKVTVSGPTSRDPNQSGTWTCSASGGVGPYTYSWFKSYDGGTTNLGGGSSKTTSHATSFNIVCDVVESNGTFLGTNFVFVDVDGDPGGPLPE